MSFINKSISVFTMLALTLASISLTSCKESETEILKDAQLCLNKAPIGQASNCLSKISGLVSAQAYELRCAASFIDEGFGDPGSLYSKLDSANLTTPASCVGVCSPSMDLVNALALTGANATTRASNAFEYCKNSQISSYVQISSLVQVATTALDINTNIKTGVENIPSSTLGQIISDTVTLGCSDTSSNTSDLNKFCTEALTAVNNAANTTEIGNCLKFKLTGINANPRPASCN